MIFNNKNDLYLELALLINKEMYEENYISLLMFQKTQEELLKKININKPKR